MRGGGRERGVGKPKKKESSGLLLPCAGQLQPTPVTHILGLPGREKRPGQKKVEEADEGEIEATLLNAPACREVQREAKGGEREKRRTPEN